MILNIETGRVYETAAEAARAAGVGASGISKVLSGKQRAAKGYHFLRVEQAPEKAALTQIRRQTTKAQTKAQRKRYAAARKAARAAKRQRDRAAKQEAKAAGKPKRRPAAPPELREARAKLREAMIRANRIAAAAERSGEKRMQGYVRQIKDLAGTRAGIPNKRTGLFLTSPQAVAEITYTEADAYQMIEEINAIEGQYTQQIQSIDAALEAQYRLRAGEGAQKRQALQHFGRSMGLLRELANRTGGKGKYKGVVYDVVVEAAQDATSEQIEQIAQAIEDYVNQASAYNADVINDIMQDWAAEVYGEADQDAEEWIPWE